jgi:hypothetical protein
MTITAASATPAKFSDLTLVGAPPVLLRPDARRLAVRPDDGVPEDPPLQRMVAYRREPSPMAFTGGCTAIATKTATARIR